MKRHEFDELSDAWNASNIFKSSPVAATFQSRLSKSMSSPLRNIGSGENFVAWETTRVIPGARAARRAITAIVGGYRIDVESTFGALRDSILPSDIVLVFLLQPDQLLTVMLENARMQVLVLNSDILFQLVSGERPFNEIIREHISGRAGSGMWRMLNPYAAHSPVKSGMFFGRRDEVSMLLSDRGRGVAVIGSRGIGKSSLLLQVEHLAERGVRPIYVNCELYSDPAQIRSFVMGQLHPKMKAAGRDLKLHEIISRTSDRVILMLDEADPLIVNCDEKGLIDFYGELKWAEARGAMVVLAGYREFRDAVLDPLHPLYFQFQELELGPLTDEDARDLVEKPLDEIGIRFKNPQEAIRRILNWSSHHPLYIQLFCHRLVELCASKGISRPAISDLKNVESDERIYKAAVESFTHTTDALEKCVAFAALSESDAFDAVDLVHRLATNWGFRPGTDVVMKTCDQLVVANVFARAGTQFKFLFAALPALIRLHQPVERLMPELTKDATRALKLS